MKQDKDEIFTELKKNLHNKYEGKTKEPTSLLSHQIKRSNEQCISKN